MSLTKKRIVVKIDQHIHAEWISKLYDDDITQTKFIRALMEAYIKDDPAVRKFVNTYKEKMKIHSKTKRNRINKNIKKARQVNEALNIGEDELDSIFDAIESSHPEL
jgi:hypothetical protein|tara:strand:+ start:322 stop:642 length:321 start_codon:yes stop_codon:yes gene_type:complete